MRDDLPITRHVVVMDNYEFNGRSRALNDVNSWIIESNQMRMRSHPTHWSGISGSEGFGLRLEDLRRWPMRPIMMVYGGVGQCKQDPCSTMRQRWAIKLSAGIFWLGVALWSQQNSQARTLGWDESSKLLHLSRSFLIGNSTWGNSSTETESLWVMTMKISKLNLQVGYEIEC